MPNRPQPLRMPVQLMRSEAERAQRPATDGMTAHSSNAHRPSCQPSLLACRIHSDTACKHDCFTSTGPRVGCGIHGQFWLQMEAVIQQLPGHRRNHETRRRSRAPYQQISSCDLHASPLLMATEAAHFNVVPPVAVFAVAHLHALVRRTPQPRHRMSPNVAAVSADAVHFDKLAPGPTRRTSNDIPCRPSPRASHGSHAKTRHWPAAAHTPATESRVRA